MQGNEFANPYKTSLGAVPKQGPLVVPFFVDFTARTAYTADLTYVQQKGYIDMIQTIYVDNSVSTVPLFLTVATTNQTFKIPANSQAYLPLAVTNKLAIQLNSNSGLVIPVFLLNVAMNPAVWSTNNPPSTNPSGGATYVQDLILEAGVVSGYYQSQEFQQVSGGTIAANVRGTKSTTGTLTTTAATTIFTGAPGFTLKNLQVFASPDSIIAAAGLITVTAAESSVGNIAQGSAFLPTIVPTGLTGAVPILNQTFDYTSKGSASNFTLTLSTVPTGGSVYYNCDYALDSFVGG